MSQIRDCRDLEYIPSVVRDFQKVYQFDKDTLRNALMSIDRAFLNVNEANECAPHYEWLKAKQVYGDIDGLEPDKIQSYALQCFDNAVENIEFAIQKLLELKLSINTQKDRF